MGNLLTFFSIGPKSLVLLFPSFHGLDHTVEVWKFLPVFCGTFKHLNKSVWSYLVGYRDRIMSLFYVSKHIYWYCFCYCFCSFYFGSLRNVWKRHMKKISYMIFPVAYIRRLSCDISSSSFFHPSKVWTMLHHGSVGASSE